jgi:hypothetical protein
MEVGAHVWLRSPQSRWGWVPARIVDREEIVPAPLAGIPEAAAAGRTFGSKNARQMVKLTLRDDVGRASKRHDDYHRDRNSPASTNDELHYFADVGTFETTLLVESSVLANNADGHPEIKLRNLPSANVDNDIGGGGGGLSSSPSSRSSYEAANTNNSISASRGAAAAAVVGGVHDLIGLTHLHEPAILHALRLRYDSDIIYTSTGPILIAINPFQKMDHLYSDVVMERYRRRGMGILGNNGSGSSSSSLRIGVTPMKNGNNDHARRRVAGTDDANGKNDALPPHAYKTADEAYRAMRRGLEDAMLMTSSSTRGGDEDRPHRWRHWKGRRSRSGTRKSVHTR